MRPIRLQFRFFFKNLILSTTELSMSYNVVKCSNTLFTTKERPSCTCFCMYLTNMEGRSLVIACVHALKFADFKILVGGQLPLKYSMVTRDNENPLGWKITTTFMHLWGRTWYKQLSELKLTTFNLITFRSAPHRLTESFRHVHALCVGSVGFSLLLMIS